MTVLLGSAREIAVVGAHCDDVPIGMGATLLALCRRTPGLKVHALVLSGAGTEREREEESAFVAFCPDAALRVQILDVPDGRAPSQWNRVKDALAAFRRTCEPDLVFGPHRGDAHQDHRLVAELLPTEFRDHLILGYEIVKWESDTPSPSVLHPIAPQLIEEKSRLLAECYPSQSGRDWFDDGTFRGLARLRGVQCHAPYAEAFVAEKLLIDFGGN